jgi:hypothetical protein
VGYRFVLACLPLLYILAGAGIAPLLQRRKAALALAMAGAVALSENAVFVGNPLSFTNAAVWPKRRAFRLAADSNLDWGQNRDKIEGWLEAAKAAPSRLEPPHFVPGYNAFGVNTLAGVWDFERHRFLREHAEPAGHYGHTYLWFDVDDELFNRFMDEERRLTAAAGAAETCADVAYDAVAAGSQAPFSSPDSSGSGRSWLVCVSLRKLADLGLRSEQGQVRIGRGVNGGPCAGEVVGAGQAVWYRLEPGVHTFCAAEVPSRRPWIPHGFDARWIVRGHGVAIGRREVEPLRGPTPPPPAGSSPRSSSPPPGPEG